MRATSKGLLAAAAIVLGGTCLAWAQGGDPACGTAAALVSADFNLPKVAAAIAKKQLNVTVVGTGSSTLGPPAGPEKAYPARLQAALAERLPGVAVNVIPHVKMRELSREAVPQFPKFLDADKPALTIWQTGTVEAVRGVDPDTFSGWLDQGISAIQAAKSDVILMNMQYSPRTEMMISLSPYSDAIRFVALQREILLFDRFAIMRRWGELNTFDLNEATKKMDTAARVHDCIGRLLSDLVLEGAGVQASSGTNIQK
jgi:ABC-type amino acid transport substrate-binding protein